MSDDPNEGFYSRALEEGVDDAQRVGWESLAIQKLRFEALLEGVAESDLTSGALSVLDVGCGMGDLVAHLQGTGRAVQYTGIDLHPEMIARARARFPEHRFECRDVRSIDERYDVVLCSGALSVRLESEEASWALVETMFSLANRVLTFNLQSMRVLDVGAQLRDDFWLVEPVEAYTRLRQITTDMVIREDTVPSDLVVYAYAPSYCRSLRGRLRQVTSMRERAEAHVSRESPGTALALLREADIDVLAPVERAAHLNLMAVSASLSGEPGVEALLRRAQESDPGSWDVADNLSRLLVSTGDVEGAAGVVARCLESGAALPAARRDELRANVHAALLETDAMEAAEALEHEVETVFARSMMQGARCLRVGRLEEARAAAERARALRPSELEASLLLAGVSQRRGEHAQALELAAQVLREAPDEDVAREVALKALRGGMRLSGDARIAFRVLLTELLDHPVLGSVVGRFRR